MDRYTTKLKQQAEAPISVLGELIRLLPDSIVLGSGFFALATLSFSHAVFFVAMLESILGFQVLKYLNNALDLVRVYPIEKSLSKVCRTGLTTQTTASLSLFTSSLRPTFPSAPVFLLAVASSYVILSMNVLSRELEMLGEQYTTRYYIARLALPILLLVVAAYRLFYSCDSPGIIVISAILGAIVGAALVQQNEAIFGPSSLNLIGVPLLRQRTATGEKLYICPTQAKT